MENKHDRITSWARLLTASAGLVGKLVWLLIAVIIVAALGRYLYLSSQAPQQDKFPSPTRTTAPVPPRIAWDEIDQALVDALHTSHRAAETFARREIAAWLRDVRTRVDEDFLDWYFSYLQQQWMGLKAIGYWTSAQIFADKPTVAERITEDIQTEFSRRVIRPRIAQLRIERIADATLTEYVHTLQEGIAAIPDQYRIPRAEWERYLSDIAVLTSETEGNRRVSLTLKALVATSAVGGTAGGMYLLKSMKAAVTKVGTKVAAKTAAKGAGKAAAQLAAKTGSKVGAKAGGKFLGPIVGIGIIIWDVWDHYATRNVERPILRQNLMEYLDEMEENLLQDPESGILTLIDNLEATMVASITERTLGPR